jgi:hypothetical protein
VIGEIATDHFGLVGLALRPQVLPGELPCSLDGVGAPGGEEDAVEITGREFGEPGGQLDSARM